MKCQEGHCPPTSPDCARLRDVCFDLKSSITIITDIALQTSLERLNEVYYFIYYFTHCNSWKLQMGPVTMMG